MLYSSVENNMAIDPGAKAVDVIGSIVALVGSRARHVIKGELGENSVWIKGASFLCWARRDLLVVWWTLKAGKLFFFFTVFGIWSCILSFWSFGRIMKRGIIFILDNPSTF